MAGKVIVIIDPKKGTTLFEVNGVEGTKCEDITAAIVRDNEILDQQYTEEYYAPEENPDYVVDPGSDE